MRAIALWWRRRRYFKSSSVSVAPHGGLPMTQSNPPDSRVSWKPLVPVKRVNSFQFNRIRKQFVSKEVRLNQGIAALDVFRKVWKRAVVKQQKLARESCIILTFKCFQQKGQLRNLDGLGVDINTKNVGCQNALLFSYGEAPLPPQNLCRRPSCWLGARDQSTT